MTTFRPWELADKIAANQPLTDEERQLAAELVRFGDQFKVSMVSVKDFGASTMILTTFDSQDGDEGTQTPTTACISLRGPSPERWRAVRAALEEASEVGTSEPSEFDPEKEAVISSTRQIHVGTPPATTIEAHAAALLHPELADALHQRTEFGIQKYGQRLDDNDQPARAWAIHAVQELMDALQYMLKEGGTELAREIAEIANDLQELHNLTAAEIVAGGKH